MHRGVISTGVEQVELLRTDICPQHVEKMKNKNKKSSRSPCTMSHLHGEGTKVKGKVPPRGGPDVPKVPPTPLATPAGQLWKLHRKPCASRVFSFYLEVSSVGPVQGLEKLIRVGDFILPQLRDQESERQKKFC